MRALFTALFIAFILPSSASARKYAMFDSDYRAVVDAPKGKGVVIERGGRTLDMKSLAEAFEQAQDGDVIRLGPGRFEDYGPKFDRDKRDWREDSDKTDRFGPRSDDRLATIKADGILVVGAGWNKTWIGTAKTYEFTEVRYEKIVKFVRPRAPRFDVRGKRVTFANLTLLGARFITGAGSAVWIVGHSGNGIFEPSEPGIRLPRVVRKAVLAPGDGWKGAPMRVKQLQYLLGTGPHWVGKPVWTLPHALEDFFRELEARLSRPRSLQMDPRFHNDSVGPIHAMDVDRAEEAWLLQFAQLVLAPAAEKEGVALPAFLKEDPEPHLKAAEAALAAGRPATAAYHAERAWETGRPIAMRRAEDLARRAVLASGSAMGIAVDLAALLKPEKDRRYERLEWAPRNLDHAGLEEACELNHACFELRLRENAQWRRKDHADVARRAMRGAALSAWPGLPWLAEGETRRTLKLTVLEASRSKLAGLGEGTRRDKVCWRAEDPELKAMYQEEKEAREAARAAARSAALAASLARLGASAERLRDTGKRLMETRASVSQSISDREFRMQTKTTIGAVRGGESAAARAEVQARERELAVARNRLNGRELSPNFYMKTVCEERRARNPRREVREKWKVRVEVIENGRPVVSGGEAPLNLSWSFEIIRPYRDLQIERTSLSTIAGDFRFRHFGGVAAERVLPVLREYMDKRWIPEIEASLAKAVAEDETAAAAEAVLAAKALGLDAGEQGRALAAGALGDADAAVKAVRGLQLADPDWTGTMPSMLYPL